MKRFLTTFLLVAAMTAVLTYFMPKDFSREAVYANGTVSIYCRETSLNSVDMGSGRIVVCAPSRLTETLSMCKGVDGISVAFDGTEQDMWRIAEKYSLTSAEILQINDLTVICGYTRKLRGSVVLDGRPVNLQIAYRNGVVTVGSPLILGSY